MAKFVVGIVVALLAIQTIPALPVSKDSWDVFQYAEFLTIRIQEESDKVTTNLPDEIKIFSDKINIIFSIHNIQFDVATFKQNIRKLTKDSPCNNNIEEDLSIVVRSSLQQINSCERQIQSIADEIDYKLKSSAKNASILAQIINYNILTCSEDHLGSYVDRKACLEAVIFDIVSQYEDLQQEVEDVLKFAVGSTEDGMGKLEECVVKVEERIVSEENRLLRSYEHC